MGLRGAYDWRSARTRSIHATRFVEAALVWRRRPAATPTFAPTDRRTRRHDMRTRPRCRRSPHRARRPARASGGARWGVVEAGARRGPFLNNGEEGRKFLHCRNSARNAGARDWTAGCAERFTGIVVKLAALRWARFAGRDPVVATLVPGPALSSQRNGVVCRRRGHSIMPRFLSSSLLALALVAPFELGRSQGPVVVLKPAAATVVVTKDIEYGRADSVILRMDVYRPAAGRGRVSPTLIFWNRATGADRSNSFYASWARAAASRGLVAVLPDLRNGNEPADFQSLMAHLTARGASVGVDHDAIAVYAASGNVSSAFPALEDPKQTGSRRQSSITGRHRSRIFVSTCPCSTYGRGSTVPG